MSTRARDGLIDGWRGLGVALVLISHVPVYRLGGIQPLRPIREVLWHPDLLIPDLALRLIGPLSITGVDVFFVISGYLITRLLHTEEGRTGAVGIRAFYVRRVFRILPAFAAYLLTMLLLRNQGLILATDEAFVRSGLFVCNLSGFRCSWWLAHTWSLSVEEQFYLVWPVAFVLLGWWGRARVPATAIIFAGLMIGSCWVPGLTSFAHIAIGALFALSSRVREGMARTGTTPVVLIAAAVIVLAPLASPVPALATGLLVVKPVLVAIVFFGTVIHHRGGPILRIVSAPWLAKVGLISYSLYLWQQLSLAPVAWGGEVTGAAGLYRAAPLLTSLLFIPAAILSYQFIERPFIRLGHRISGRILERVRDGQPHSARVPLTERSGV